MDDFFTGLVQRAEFPESLQHCMFQGVRWQTRSLAEVLASFMIPPGADVVAIDAASTVSSGTDRMGTALATKQSGQKIPTTPGLLEVLPAFDRLSQPMLHSVNREYDRHSRGPARLGLS